ncbi:hypothetical protein [Acrocarpospora catenulata]|uniref:hypothetical protein n=1 Tax=Acrocarpospora catenulata TaxID=2836182 RepID=UPI001BDAAEA6|nr:hypothetical protein [Acrocarpospora catenulata]
MDPFSLILLAAIFLGGAAVGALFLVSVGVRLTDRPSHTHDNSAIGAATRRAVGFHHRTPAVPTSDNDPTRQRGDA